jgi:hypothetical protein
MRKHKEISNFKNKSQAFLPLEPKFSMSHIYTNAEIKNMKFYLDVS